MTGAGGYRLTRLALGQQPSIELTQEDYQSIIAARKTLNEIRNIEEKFLSICENIVQLQSFVFNISIKHLIYTIFDTSSLLGPKTDFSRLMLSLLSSCRLYQDSIGTHIKIVSDGAKGNKEVKSILSEIYDGNIFYRSVEAIRNYSQHRAFPTHTITFGGKWDYDQDTNYNEVSFFFESRNIEPYDNFKKSIKDEIEKLGGRIDLKEYTWNYFCCFCEIHMATRKIIKKYRDEAEATLNHWRSAWLEIDPNDKIIGVAAAAFIGDFIDKNQDKAYIDYSIDEYRIQVERMTHSLQQMQKRKVVIQP